MIKYKPIYKVTVSGEEVGYVKNQKAFEETLKETILEKEEKNIDMMDIKIQPQYTFTLVERNVETNEQEIANKMQDDVIVTYKYYEIAFENEVMEKVDSLEEAENIVKAIKEEKQEEQEEIDLKIIEKYTQNAN